MKNTLNIPFRSTCLILTSLIRADEADREKEFDRNAVNSFEESFLRAFSKYEMHFKCNHVVIDLINELEIASGGIFDSVLPSVIAYYAEQRQTHGQVFAFQQKLDHCIKYEDDILGTWPLDSGLIQQLEKLVLNIEGSYSIGLLYSCTELLGFLQSNRYEKKKILSRLIKVIKLLVENALELDKLEDINLASISIRRLQTLRTEESQTWYLQILDKYYKNKIKFWPSSEGMRLILEAYSALSQQPQIKQIDSYLSMIEDLILAMQVRLGDKITQSFENDFTQLVHFSKILLEYPTIQSFIKSLDISTLETAQNYLIVKIMENASTTHCDKIKMYIMTYVLSETLAIAKPEDLMNYFDQLRPKIFESEPIIRFSLYNLISSIIIKRDESFVIEFWNKFKQFLILAIKQEKSLALQVSLAQLILSTIKLEIYEVFTLEEYESFYEFLDDLQFGENLEALDSLLKVAFSQAEFKKDEPIEMYANTANKFIMKLLNKAKPEHKIQFASKAIGYLNAQYEHVSSYLKEGIQNYFNSLVNCIKGERNSNIDLKIYLYPLSLQIAEYIKKRNPLFLNKQTEFLLQSLLIFEQDVRRCSFSVVIDSLRNLNEALSDKSFKQLKFQECQDSTLLILKQVSLSINEEQNYYPEAFQQHKQLFNSLVFTQLARQQEEIVVYIIPREKLKNPRYFEDELLRIYQESSDNDKTFQLRLLMKILNANSVKWRAAQVQTNYLRNLLQNGGLPEQFKMEVDKLICIILKVQQNSSNYLKKERSKARARSLYALEFQNQPSLRAKKQKTSLSTHLKLQDYLGYLMIAVSKCLSKQENQDVMFKYIFDLKDKLLQMHCLKNSEQRLQAKHFKENPKMLKDLDLLLIPQTLFFLNIIQLISSLFFSDFSELLQNLLEKVMNLSSQPDCQLIRDKCKIILHNFVNHEFLQSSSKREIQASLQKDVKRKFQKTWIDEILQIQYFQDVDIYKDVNQKFNKGTPQGQVIDQMLADSNLFDKYSFPFEQALQEDPQERLDFLNKQLQEIELMNDEELKEYREYHLEVLKKQGFLQPEYLEQYEKMMDSKATLIEDLKKDIRDAEIEIQNKYKNKE